MAGYEILTPDCKNLDDVCLTYDPRGQEIRLDLGCGYYKKAGFIGLDNFVGAESQIKTNRGPDIRIDLSEEAIPFSDDSVIEIFTSHFLEHVPMDRLLKEIYRVLAPTGAIQIVLPYANSAAGMYPGHIGFYTEQWFEQNELFNTLFSVYRLAWRKTPLYDQLPIGLTQTLPFHLARRTMFNICDEFMIFAIPKKRTDVNYASLQAETLIYSA